VLARRGLVRALRGEFLEGRLCVHRFVKLKAPHILRSLDSGRWGWLTAFLSKA
jgi:hypothetical protein